MTNIANFELLLSTYRSSKLNRRNYNNLSPKICLMQSLDQWPAAT